MYGVFGYSIIFGVLFFDFQFIEVIIKDFIVCLVVLCELYGDDFGFFVWIGGEIQWF